MSLASPSPIDAANEQALQRIYVAMPYLVAVRPASDLLPQLGTDTILHAGPPVAWEVMCGPMQGAIVGAVHYEGWAADLQSAQALVESGRIRLQPCHSLSAVGPMTGVITPSMPLMVVENREHGNRAYCTLNEGLGKVLRYGTAFGIRVSALGERWFTAPAPMPQGLYFPGFSATDANPDMGDSAIVETLRLE